MLSLSPAELDAQSPTKVERWVDINSKELQEMDDMPTLTRNWLEIGMRESGGRHPFFQLDKQGRVWYQLNDNELYQPFTFSYYGKEIGIRIATKAVS